MVETKPRLNKPLLITFKLLIYMAIFAGFYLLSATIMSKPAPFVAFFLTILLVTVNRGKLTDFIQQLVDKGFYRDLYRFKKFADKFNRELNATLDWDTQLNNCRDFLKLHFGENESAFYLIENKELLNAHPGDRKNSTVEQMLPEPDAPSPFSRGTNFYPIEQLWREFPRYRPLFKALRDGHKFEYIVPLNGSNSVVGFLAFTDRINTYLSVPEIREFLNGLFLDMAETLENARTHAEIQRKSLENELFLKIVQNISSSLNVQEVLDNMLDSLSLLLQYDAAMIALVDENRMELRQMVSRGYSPNDEEAISLKIGQGLSGWVIQNREGVLTPDVTKNSQYYSARPDTQSQITVPIIVNEHAIGALALESNTLNHFTQKNLKLLTNFAGLAAIALRNAQLYEDSLKKQRLEGELLVASKVQQALLPRRVPVIDGVTIEVLNVPSLIVGGDLYDAFRIDENRQAIAIGDVSGKGAPGAILMAVAYAGFKSLFNEIDPPATIVAKLNNLLYEATATGYYVTFFFAILDRSSGQLTYCNAGHNAPILLRKDGSTVMLKEGGTVLGFLENRTFHQNTVDFRPGDTLVCFTDGVTETQNVDEEEFGDERLMQTLKTNLGEQPKTLKIAILDDMRTFAGDCEFPDDVTLLIARLDN